MTTKNALLIIFFLILSSKINSGIEEGALFNELFSLVERLPDQKIIMDEFSKAINFGDLGHLEVCATGLENYFDAFCELEKAQKLSQLKEQYLKELKSSAHELISVTQNAKMTISRIFWLTGQDFLKAKKRAGIKQVVIQAGCAGTALFSAFGTNFSESALSGLSNLLKNSHFYKFGLTGLGISIFLAISFSMKNNNASNALCRIGHLNSMIFCLNELSWQMNNLFAQHKKSLDQLKILLDQTENYFQQLLNWPKLIDWQTLSDEQTQTIIQLVERECIEFCELTTKIRNEQISTMALSKAMRALRKTQNYALDQIILQFSDIEKLRQINPIGIDNIEENHLFFITNYKHTKDSILEYFAQIKNNDESIDQIDLSWTRPAKVLLKSCQLFFGFNKPGYYGSIIKSFIQDAESEIKRTMK